MHLLDFFLTSLLHYDQSSHTFLLLIDFISSVHPLWLRPPPMSIAATADELDPYSREFFERAKMKMAYSIIYAAGAMTMLGFASISG